MLKREKAIKNNSLKKFSILSAVALVASCAIVMGPEKLNSVNSSFKTSAFNGFNNGYYGWNNGYYSWDDYDGGYRAFSSKKFKEKYETTDEQEKQDLQLIGNLLETNLSMGSVMGELGYNWHYDSNDVVTKIAKQLAGSDEYRALVNSEIFVKQHNVATSYSVETLGKSLTALQDRVMEILEMLSLIIDSEQYTSVEKSEALVETLKKSDLNFENLIRVMNFKKIFSNSELKQKAKQLIDLAREAACAGEPVGNAKDFGLSIDKSELKQLSSLLLFLTIFNRNVVRSSYQIQALALVRGLANNLEKLFYGLEQVYVQGISELGDLVYLVAAAAVEAGENSRFGLHFNDWLKSLRTRLDSVAETYSGDYSVDGCIDAVESLRTKIMDRFLTNGYNKMQLSEIKKAELRINSENELFPDLNSEELRTHRAEMVAQSFALVRIAKLLHGTQSGSSSTRLRLLSALLGADFSQSAKGRIADVLNFCDEKLRTSEKISTFKNTIREIHAQLGGLRGIRKRLLNMNSMKNTRKNFGLNRGIFNDHDYLSRIIKDSSSNNWWNVFYVDSRYLDYISDEEDTKSSSVLSFNRLLEDIFGFSEYDKKNERKDRGKEMAQAVSKMFAGDLRDTEISKAAMRQIAKTDVARTQFSKVAYGRTLRVLTAKKISDTKIKNMQDEYLKNYGDIVKKLVDTGIKQEDISEVNSLEGPYKAKQFWLKGEHFAQNGIIKGLIVPTFNSITRASDNLPFYSVEGYVETVDNGEGKEVQVMRLPSFRLPTDAEGGAGLYAGTDPFYELCMLAPISTFELVSGGQDEKDSVMRQNLVTHRLSQEEFNARISTDLKQEFRNFNTGSIMKANMPAIVAEPDLTVYAGVYLLGILNGAEFMNIPGIAKLSGQFSKFGEDLFFGKAMYGLNDAGKTDYRDVSSDIDISKLEMSSLSYYLAGGSSDAKLHEYYKQNGYFDTLESLLRVPNAYLMDYLGKTSKKMFAALYSKDAARSDRNFADVLKDTDLKREVAARKAQIDAIRDKFNKLKKSINENVSKVKDSVATTVVPGTGKPGFIRDYGSFDSKDRVKAVEREWQSSESSTSIKLKIQAKDNTVVKAYVCTEEVDKGKNGIKRTANAEGIKGVVSNGEVTFNLTSKLTEGNHELHIYSGENLVAKNFLFKLKFFKDGDYFNEKNIKDKKEIMKRLEVKEVENTTKVKFLEEKPDVFYDESNNILEITLKQNEPQSKYKELFGMLFESGTKNPKVEHCGFVFKLNDDGKSFTLRNRVFLTKQTQELHLYAGELESSRYIGKIVISPDGQAVESKSKKKTSDNALVNLFVKDEANKKEGEVKNTGEKEIDFSIQDDVYLDDNLTISVFDSQKNVEIFKCEGQRVDSDDSNIGIFGYDNYFGRRPKKSNKFKITLNKDQLTSLKSENIYLRVTGEKQQRSGFIGNSISPWFGSKKSIKLRSYNLDKSSLINEGLSSITLNEEN